MSVVIEAKTLIEAVENAKNKLATEKIIYKSKERESGKIFKYGFQFFDCFNWSFSILISDSKEIL